MTLPTSGVPITPVTNPISEAVSSIQTWGTTVVVCLVIIAASCAIMAVLLVRDTIKARKQPARLFND